MNSISSADSRTVNKRKKIWKKSLMSLPLFCKFWANGVLTDRRNILGHRAMPRPTVNKVIRFLKSLEYVRDVQILKKKTRRKSLNKHKL